MPPSPPSPASILSADPDLTTARTIASLLRARGLRATACQGGAVLERALAEPGYDLVVCDIEMFGGERGHGRTPDAPGLILTSAFASVDDEVRALRGGALGCLPKPVDEEQLLLAVARALEARALARENDRLRRDLEGRERLGSLVTRDPATRRVLQLAESIAPTRATVLVEGESGTGKTLLARAIHRASGRVSAAPFVEVSCGAIPAALLESELFGHARGAFTGATRDRAGKFEAADGGTLFLDEIGAAPLDLQLKLLRVLQDRAFERLGETRTRTADVRVVAATNEDLGAAVAAGRFREDLYWRIRVVSLRLPPLRERRGDVPVLAAHFLERYLREHRRPALEIAPDALARLTSWHWPGNVRELEHCMERAVLLATRPRICADDLGLYSPRGPLSGGPTGGSPDERRAPVDPRNPHPEAFCDPSEGVPEPWVACLRSLFDASRPFTLREALAIPEREILRLALELHGGRRQETARMLGLNRSTLFNKMRRHGLLGTPRGARPGDPGAR